MYYIFIDESGDLGTKKSSSNYFVMAGIKVDEHKKLDRIIARLETPQERIPYQMKLKGITCQNILKLKS